MWLLVVVLLIGLGWVALAMHNPGPGEWLEDAPSPARREDDEVEDEDRLCQICGWHHYNLGSLCDSCKERNGSG